MESGALIDFLKTITTNALAIGIISLFVKSYLSQRDNKNLEEHKNSLNTALESYKSKLSYLNSKSLETIKASFLTDIEKVKSDLVRENSQFAVKFSKLHERRAEAMLEFYRNLVEIKSIIECISSESLYIDQNNNIVPKDELKKRLFTEFNKANHCYAINKIFYTPSLSEKLDELLRITLNAIFLTTATSIFKNDQINIDENLFSPEVIKSTIKAIRGVLTSIEKEFRVLLGVEDK